MVSNTTEPKKTDENIVFVGSKPLVNYIRSVSMLFNKNNAEKVKIKSRGKFISKAVDIAEVAKRTIQNINVHSIDIASESFTTNEKTTNISTMELTLARI